MHDFTHLKFPDEETARKVTGWWDAESGWAEPRPGLEIVIRGQLYADCAQYDMNGVLLKEATPLEGWHIDVISGEIPAAAEPFVINPATSMFDLA
ncbi:TPA: hypothetical protein ACOEF8_002042 [Enterobacter roggenkampii]